MSLHCLRSLTTAVAEEAKRLTQADISPSCSQRKEPRVNTNTHTYIYIHIYTHIDVLALFSVADHGGC